MNSQVVLNIPASSHTPQISTTPLLSIGFQVSTHMKIQKHHHKQQAFWLQVHVVNWREEELLLISHSFWGEEGRQGRPQNALHPRLAWNSVIQRAMLFLFIPLIFTENLWCVEYFASSIFILGRSGMLRKATNVRAERQVRDQVQISLHFTCKKVRWSLSDAELTFLEVCLEQLKKEFWSHTGLGSNSNVPLCTCALGKLFIYKSQFYICRM